LNKGDVIQIKVERYAFEGKGIGKVDLDNPSGNSEPDSFIVFVNGAYPGDTVSAKIKKLKKTYAEAIVEEVISPSQQRVQPRGVNTLELAADANSRIWITHSK